MAKTIKGRIKSDLRFGSTLTWYTFPVPELDEKTRQRIIKAGKKVLDARALHPERSLAEQYNPLAIAPELIKAHDALDREVDKAFGASVSSRPPGSARSYCLPITKSSPHSSPKNTWYVLP